MPDVKPMSPDEVLANKKLAIPDEVIEAVNALLVQNASPHGGRIILQQKQVVKEIVHRMSHLTSEDVFSNRYLDFESLFEEQGWKVQYDKPGYNESYEPYFEFIPKRGR